MERLLQWTAIPSMIDEIAEDARERMAKTVESLRQAFARIRTGRANPTLLDCIEVDYYGVQTPIKQVASIKVEEGRTLVVTPWEKSLLSAIEKELLKSDLGITPQSKGDLIRLPLPPLTEENRRNLVRQSRVEAEQARVAARQVRRDAIHDIREMVKEKMLTEDDGYRGEDDIQKVTDACIANIQELLDAKEADLIEI